MFPYKLTLVKIFLLSFAIKIPTAFAQKNEKFELLLKSGTVTPSENSDDINDGKPELRQSSSGAKILRIIQFKIIPTSDQIQLLKGEGIELLEYIPNNSYTAVVSRRIDPAILKKYRVRSVVKLRPEQKIDFRILNNSSAANNQKEGEMIDIRMKYVKPFSLEEIKKELLKRNIRIVSETLTNHFLIDIRINKAVISELAAQEFVEYISIIPGASQPLNDKSEAATRANVINTGIPLELQLNGKGVVVGVGDNANPFKHVDFNSRILHTELLSDQWHGVHVIGTIAGAGLANEKYRGYAPKSSVVVRGNDQIFHDASGLVSDFGMVLTNNSYASGYGDETCDNLGQYYDNAYELDEQAFSLPNLQHVFAGGNSGFKNVCSQYPPGFGTVLSEYASAKNVITVGYIEPSGLIGSVSSKGPVKDGRIKPEIVAPGSGILSTYPENQYRSATGTSMAASATTGGLTLLYQQYRKLNSQANPKNALIKALLCNGATDQGLAGPDYSYGFGTMNLLRSVNMLDSSHYFSGNLSHGNAASHTIHVAQNVASLKVMLYWNDPGANLYASKTLVNNLDLTVTDTRGTKNYPFFPTPEQAGLPAKSGIDDMNNIEQVVIDNPAAGEYSFEVNAKLIPKGVQEYFIVYDPIPVSSKLTYPVGQEHFSSGDFIYISWDSYGNPSSTFKVEYSLDNGQSWTAIASAVSGKERQVGWNIPNAVTENARVRITQNETGWSEQSGNFTILGAPVVALTPVQCPNYISINWTAVEGASDYEVMWVKNDEMESVAITKSLNFTFSGLSKDSSYVVSVRARRNEIAGRRGVAVIRTPNNGSCAGSISDNDLMIDAILSPAESGRLYTASELSAEQPITIKIKNLDDQASGQPFSVGYSLSGNKADVIWETINPVISELGSYEHTFKKKARMDAPGIYNLTVYVDKTGDLVASNNSLNKKFKQLNNSPLSLPYFEDMEKLEVQQILAGSKGLEGSDLYDFSSNTAQGRLRTKVNSGIGFSGTKALTVDVNRQTTDNVNSLTGTYNLSRYSTSSDEIILSYQFRVHEAYQSSEPILVRASETDSWIQVYPNFSTDDLKDGYYLIRIMISKIFKENNKEFSNSVQVKWQRSINDMTFSISGKQGMSLDDIRIDQVHSDFQITKVEFPDLSCFQSYVKVTAAIKNNINIKGYSVPIKASINQRTVHDGTSYFGADGVGEYTFYIYPSNFSSGPLLLKVWTDQISDTDRTNDTLSVEIKMPAVISSFPYLQDFEQGQGDWQASGTNSSWAYGGPNSPKINKAASGDKAWKTNLTGNYNNNELSYLYSPCFNIGSMQNPTLSFSLALDLESDQLSDATYVEYQVNEYGWNKLDYQELGVNWYNAGSYYYGDRCWSIKDYTRWHVSTIPLPRTTTIRFRFVVRSNGSITREGLAIDDIHIYDKIYEIYSSSPVSNEIILSKSTSGGWVPFTDQNKIIASLQPKDGQAETVKTQTYLAQDKSPYSNGQYYLRRNFTVKPSDKNLLKAATVRLYFTDQEVENLLAASGCVNCEKPSSAYDLAISNYSSIDPANDDGNIKNNNPGKWTFYDSSKTRIVPYGTGYYAEFPSTTFSEFWLAKNNLGNDNPLPVNLVSFIAKKKATTFDYQPVLLEWITSGEKNFSHFEVETTTSLIDLRAGNFQRLARVSGSNSFEASNTYNYLHDSPKQALVNYYRLKMVDMDSSFSYSHVASVSFEQLNKSIIYPNPSNGIFELSYQSQSSKLVTAKIYDLKGSTLKSFSWMPDGLNKVQKIDLSSPEFTPGDYILETTQENIKQFFKIMIY